MMRTGEGMRETVALYHPAFAGRYLELLVPRFPDLDFVPATDEASAQEALAAAEILLAQISFPGKLLGEAPHMRWIQVMGAGTDALTPHVPAGIRLSRFTGSLGLRMAEYAIAYVFAVAQRIPEVLRNQATQHWEPLRLEAVRGKRLGVAGFGSVGAEVVRLGAAIGMLVGGCSRQRPTCAAVEEWFPSAAFADLLGWADFVVLALPATPRTRHIVNRDALARMRPGAWLLNISRGVLIDEEALIEGLREGRPTGAVLDVFETEPLPREHPFWEMPNVIVTSHQSGSVIPEEVVELFAENLVRYRQGKPLINEVDLTRGY
jgi:phosphoglycerate dehydrogenase-like enzyme